MVSISVSKRKVYIIYSNMLTARIIRILRQKKITDVKSLRPSLSLRNGIFQYLPRAQILLSVLLRILKEFTSDSLPALVASIMKS